jgi:2-oxoacid:acceptor oxidoreductase delta subunit (pyruvate/2-ketoisovalerate family)
MATKKRSDLAKTYAFNSWRDITPLNISLGTMLHNRTGSWRFIRPIYEDKVPACQNACPAGNDIEGWIKHLEKGDYENAYWHLKREQPFPAILGRICFNFCEDACNRNPLDQCVSIKELERFVGDQVSGAKPYPDLPAYNGKCIAVVGSGPAGMSAAYFARLLGFKVTIYEKLTVMGGILRVGIPAYRLPRELVATELDRLSRMGIKMHPATEIGKDISLAELRDKNDYIFLGTGVHASMKLGIPQEDESHCIISGLDLLIRTALGDTVELGKQVVIIGGGNTAIDCARSALRLGSEATIVYRRSENEMPAHPQEILEARQEGVRFRFLAAPEKIVLNADRTIKTMLCCEMQLGPADESGRRRPVKKKGASFEVIADTVVSAIGEKPVFEYLQDNLTTKNERVVVQENLMAHVRDDAGAKVFAGGDIIDVAHTVVHAVASGKKAAIAMDCDRNGSDFGFIMEKIRIGDGPAISFAAYKGWQPVNPVSQNQQWVLKSENIVYDYFKTIPRIKPRVKDADTRKHTFSIYKDTLAPNAAKQEAARCMHCGRCTECDNCLIFCPDMSVLVKENNRFGYRVDYDYCKGCGICFTECPRHAITMIDEEVPLKEDG